MTVRLRLALTVLFTGLATALGVLVAVALAFERFEREAAYARADAFLGRVVAQHEDLPAQQRRDPEGFVAFLRSLLLLEPDSQLYLLAPDGTVLASSGSKPLMPDFKVAVTPVQRAAAAGQSPAAPRSAAYVMGDDPEYMDEGAVIAARALQQLSIRPGADLGGYLYLVSRKPGLPPSRLARLAEHLAGPALGPVLAVVLLASLLAAWIIAAVTRPLAVLSEEVARAARTGFDADVHAHGALAPPRAKTRSDDEFGRLHSGFQALLAKLRAQWDQLRRLDAFRRESVSNLSHDLRSPLTAAAASLETLQQRWQAPPAALPPAADAQRAEDLRLLDVALRNTHNAARLVRSLGDLAVLDEARFRLRLARLDLGEMLDDIAMRFAERAARQGVALVCELDAAPASASGGGGGASEAPDASLVAEVDVELIERAVANLIDNALRFTPAGGRIVLSARPGPGRGARGDGEGAVHITVRDTGSGIAAADLEHLFERHFRGGGRRPGDLARSDSGNGLGLAIVQRIVELHGGTVAVRSEPGRGTEVALDLPVSVPGGAPPAQPVARDE